MLNTLNHIIEILAEAPTEFWLLTITILSLCVGSFLNVVIYRIPKILEYQWHEECREICNINSNINSENNVNNIQKISLSKPDSSCPNCNHKIKFYENIPVLSYIFLGGKCSQCKQKISLRYPFVELLTAALSLLCIYYFGVSSKGFASVVFIWFLIALTFIDFDTQLLPDNLTFPLLWLGLIVNLQNTFVPISDAVIGAIVGYLSLWLVFWIFKLLTGREGMGYGDFKLLSALGAWLGWQMILPIILMSSLVGAVVGISLIVMSKLGKDVPIPFGPYLAGGGVLALFFGDTILQIWLY